MKNILCLLVVVCSVQSAFSQLVINELDSDTQGIDDLEIVELKSETPDFITDGFVLVFFNGSSNGRNTSYLALDLDGYKTDANGILLIGSAEVSPAPDIVLPDNTIQNGADAVAIYRADASNFPEFTPATSTFLIDALVYDTSDKDDMELLELLNETEQINENENNNKKTESIQRNNDGTYVIKKPTPGYPTNGEGIKYIGISISTDTLQYQEGTTMEITFKTDKILESDLTFDFTLTTDNFNQADYNGNVKTTIPKGKDSITVPIQILNDARDEGDELMVIKFGTLPDTIKRLNDRLSIFVIDTNYAKALWGSPLEPTFGLVDNKMPVAYYNTLQGKQGNALRIAIGDIIADPTSVRSHTYEDIIDILKEADQSPINGNQVWLLYSEKERSKIDFQLTSSQKNKWNREHIYPRSRGGYMSIKEDEIADGIDVFSTTNKDSIRHGNSDAHGIRPVDSRLNSSRGNKNFGDYIGPKNNIGSWHGDVARSIFYMTVRYTGLKVVPGSPPSKPDGFIGDLNVLLQWHRNDPPDDYEMNRNNVIYTWQKNRNPFIDEPELVEYIWGNKTEQQWDQKLSIKENKKSEFLIYPNPTSKFVYIFLKEHAGKVTIYNTLGTLVLSKNVKKRKTKVLLDLEAGLYIVKIEMNGQEVTQKLLIH